MVFTFSLAVLFIISGFFFVNQARKNKKMESLFKYSIGIALFMFILGLNGFIDFGTIISTDVIGGYDLIPQDKQFMTYGKSSFYIILTLLMISFAVLSFQIERYIKRSKHLVFTYTLIICFFITLIPYFGFAIPSEYHRIIMIIAYSTQLPFALIIVYWGVFYLALAAKTAGIVRKRALLVGFGLGFTFGGIIFDTMYRWMVTGEYLFPLICKIIGNLGIIFMLEGFRREEL